MENDPLEVFIENLMQEINREKKMEPEVYQQFKSDLLDSAEDIINRELINALSTEKLAEFNSILDEDLSDEEYQTFFVRNIENTDEIVLNALLELKSKYIKNKF
jgi:hypothetical protein